MLPVDPREPVPGFVAVLRFRSDDAQAAAATIARLREAVGILAQQPGFVDARVARSTDDATLILATISWETVGAYRRALSSYDVKLSVIPLLADCIDEPSSFEVLHVSDSQGVADAPGALAADAATIGLGSAAARSVPPAPS